jgi:secondary thiamine-phosphate synthase enzyme
MTVERSLNRLAIPGWNDGLVIFFKDFSVTTRERFDVVDITEDVFSVVQASGVVNGTVLVFCPHTTCSVVVTANDPRLVHTLRRSMQQIAPEGAYYAHDDLDIRTENLVPDEPANGPAHIMNAVMGKTSEVIPVTGGQLALAGSQRILFVEFDSARARQYCIQITGE